MLADKDEDMAGLEMDAPLLAETAHGVVHDR